MLALDGLGWLLVGVTLGGLVRGFSGFGTAMVYLPFAGAVLEPVWALTTLVVMDLIGPLPNVPRALRDGHARDVLRLGLGALAGLPLGVGFLVAVPPEVFRYAVSLISLLLLALLAGGLRYRGAMTRPLVFGTGALGGVLAGGAGLPGPPAIMLYMARPLPAAAIRANLLLYLLLTDLLMLAVFGLSGLVGTAPVLVGAVLALPYTFANIAGAAIFKPERQRLYRAVAYLVIAASALRGLPLFG
ncbi:sulfite exporter TauE/SafE family protein [Maritimibacter sp. 55A14]|nr:sulfite exporter TauE/SafE family protein [Maritimibacter sp. 55A14]